MIKLILKNLSIKGRMMMSLAIVFFTLYALAGTTTMLIVLKMLEKITSGAQFNIRTFWLALAVLVVIKTVFNVIADMAKHFAGFDIVEHLREKNSKSKNLLSRVLY